MTTLHPPRNVLVGIDAEGRSDPAVHAALDLRKRFGSHVELLHVVHLPPPEWIAGRPIDVANQTAEIEADAWQRLAKRLEPALKDGGGGAATEDLLQVRVGVPAQTLVERARELPADLVVLGAHERHGFLDFGSTARAVLASAPCDVWVQPAEHRPIRRVLVPVDLSEESLKALTIACSLASELGASVTAVHCFQPPEFAYVAAPGFPQVGPTYVVDDLRGASRHSFEEALAKFDWRGVEHSLRFVEGNPVGSILDLQDSCDLIAMGSHGRTGLSAAVLGNVAYAVLKKAHVPVLAIRHPQRDWLL